MKKFALGWVCAGLLVACGGEGDTTVLPSPLSPDAATGRYDLVGTLDVDTCADPSLASDEEFEFGEWILALTADEYLFFTGDFLLSSSDGVTFTYTDTFSGLDCPTETVKFTITLGFTTGALSGSIVSNYSATGCFTWEFDENDEPIFEDRACSRTWSTFGTRQ